MNTHTETRPTVLLVGVDLHQRGFDAELRELAQLARTARFDPAVRMTCKRAAPDAARFVPVGVVDQLKTSLAALSAKLHERERDDVLAPALADGRLLPAEEAGRDGRAWRHVDARGRLAAGVRVVPVCLKEQT